MTVRSRRLVAVAVFATLVAGAALVLWASGLW
jgi:hypothetical protein